MAEENNAIHLRGIADDSEEVAYVTFFPTTAAQTCTHFDLMLREMANYCRIISRKAIIKYSTSINSFWQSSHLHYGFQSTNGHLLDFYSTK